MSYGIFMFYSFYRSLRFSTQTHKCVGNFLYTGLRGITEDIKSGASECDSDKTCARSSRSVLGHLEDSSDELFTFPAKVNPVEAQFRLI